MEYALVQDGQIVSTELPETGELLDGSQVSGFDKLDQETLAELGWLPIERPDPPNFDAEKQIVSEDGWSIKHDKVVLKYKVEVVPLQTPEPVSVDDQFDNLVALLVSKGTITQGDVAGIKKAKHAG